MRRLHKYSSNGKNTLKYWYKARNPFRVILNFMIIYFGGYLPSLAIKRSLYRMIGMNIEKDVSIALKAMFCIFFPELITIKKNSVIGYNVTILAHEFLVNEWRKGEVYIGENVLVGANSTILPGVKIGDNAVIHAMSLVNKDVPPGAHVAGNPAQIIESEKDE